MRAFVLSGEGAKGAYQIGLMQSLENKGIKPDLIMGNSSGSATAAIYAHGGLPACKEFVFETRKTSDVFGFNYNFLWKQGIFNTKPLKKRLKRYLHREISTPCVINTLNTTNSKLNRYIWRPGDYILLQKKLNVTAAAVAIQFLVEPVRGEADAGARELLPIGEAIKAGAREIYVLLASPPRYPVEPPPTGFLSFARIGFDMINYLIDQNLVNDLINIDRRNKCGDRYIDVKVIGPTETIGHQLEFDRAREYYNRGLKDFIYYDISKVYPDEER